MYLGLDESADCDYFVDALYLGYDIRCIITIGSSKYNFEVSSEGFAEMLQETYEIHSSKDALKVFLDDTYRRAGILYLMYSSYDLVPVESEELANIIIGYWKTKELESNSYSYFYEYTADGTIKTVGKFIADELVSEDDKEWEYYLDDYVVCRSDGAMFQYIKIMDGYYLVIYRATWGVEYSYIYIACQENGMPLYPIT